MSDFIIYEGDPDAIFMETMELFACGKAERQDVEAAMSLALEQPHAKWRRGIEHRYAALVLWTSLPSEFDAMLERALSYGVTVKSPRGVQ